MPTYEYECKSCHYRFEAFQSIKDQALKKCPKCGKSLRRLFGGGMGIIFKGSGFYTTDYKHSSAVTSGNGSSKSPPKSEKGETKPSTEKTEPAGKK